MRNEYAQTAVDFVARRCRLAFLNAQAALDALPRIVEIMSEELGWNSSRRKRELQQGAEFLQSMGLIGGLELELEPRTWVEWTRSLVFGWKPKLNGRAYSRAQFEAGEVDSLRSAFSAHAEKEDMGTGQTKGQLRLSKDVVRETLRSIPGYDAVKDKDFQYVLLETGLSRNEDFDFDEFIDVRSSLFFICQNK